MVRKKAHAGARKALVAEQDRLRADLDRLEAGLDATVGDTAGDDQLDAGNKALSRDQTLSLARGLRDTLEQADHALARIADGTYGTCETCGGEIGEARLEAFPRATECVECKARNERR